MFTKVGDDPSVDTCDTSSDWSAVDNRGTYRPTRRCRLRWRSPRWIPPRIRLLIYRYTIGPDQTLETAEIDQHAVVDVPILWLTGAWFSDAPAVRLLEPARFRKRSRTSYSTSTTAPTLAHREARTTDSAGPRTRHGCCGHREECDVAVGSAEPPEAARRCCRRHRAAIVKRVAKACCGNGAGSTIVPRTSCRSSAVSVRAMHSVACSPRFAVGVGAGTHRRVLQRRRRDRGIENAVLRLPCQQWRGHRSPEDRVSLDDKTFASLTETRSALHTRSPTHWPRATANHADA